MNKDTAYNAEKARKDYEKKFSMKSEYVDDKKIEDILEKIKKKISSWEVDSKSSIVPSPEYMYSAFLSQGEIDYLRYLGYKVTYHAGRNIDEEYYSIKW